MSIMLRDTMTRLLYVLEERSRFIGAGIDLFDRLAAIPSEPSRLNDRRYIFDVCVQFFNGDQNIDCPDAEEFIEIRNIPAKFSKAEHYRIYPRKTVTASDMGMRAMDVPVARSAMVFVRYSSRAERFEFDGSEKLLVILCEHFMPNETDLLERLKQNHTDAVKRAESAARSPEQQQKKEEEKENERRIEVRGRFRDIAYGLPSFEAWYREVSTLALTTEEFNHQWLTDNMLQTLHIHATNAIPFQEKFSKK